MTTHIKDLRQKLKASGVTEEIIETVYGLGYRLKAPPEQKNPQPAVHGSRLMVHSKQSTMNHQPKGLASVNKVLERFRTTFAQQITVLEQATIALSAGSLSDDLRQSAFQEAHKLAGSLGTFGYPEGSKLAREIEHQLMGKATLGHKEVTRLNQLQPWGLAVTAQRDLYSALLAKHIEPDTFVLQVSQLLSDWQSAQLRLWAAWRTATETKPATGGVIPSYERSCKRGRAGRCGNL